MSDQILRDLVFASSTVVLERLARGELRIVSRKPKWFVPFCGSEAAQQLSIGSGVTFSFLENFLVDAEAFWGSRRDGELRSGPWDERTADGRMRRLEAVAYCLGDRSVLTVAKLGSGLRDRYTLLQAARENRLAFERLERAQKALQQSERQNRSLIELLEAQKANLLAVLNQLRAGTILLDPEGRILFINRSCQSLIGLKEEPALGRSWKDVLPFSGITKDRIEEMLTRPAEARRRIPTELELADNRRYWMEIDIQDDPLDAGRLVLYFYDISEVQDLRRLIAKRGQALGIVGESEPMRRVLREIDELGRVDITVLIEGKTGTGKELVARELHAVSSRRDKPFVAMNCAGLTESILSSQLFGHKKGAFTGAIADQQGLFESAGGGTLFLDEVGDMPLAVQASLLRVLQEREITRLGETKPRKIDVRILAATNRDLREEAACGRFRTDLLYRIRVAQIQLPPLRERGDDLYLLSNVFLQEFCAAISKSVQAFGPEALRLLKKHDWPGNVRELRGVVELAVIRCRGATIQPQDLPPDLYDEHDPVPDPDPVSAVSGHTPADEMERLRLALEKTGGNRTAAARLLGMSRATLYRRLADYDI